jgi:AcrR family transcriptional regulator
MEQPIKKTRTRGRLSPDLIVDAAFEVMEKEGMAGFSTRKLAAALGCEAMSIYHHFPSVAHLFEAMVDRLIGSLEIPSAELPWRQRLRMAMEDYREVGRAHPSFAPFLVTYRMNSPTCLAWLDGVIGLIRDGGFDVETGARLFRTIGYYLTGAVIDETAGYARGPSAVNMVSDEQLARDFPNVAAAGRFFGTAEFHATFNLGVDLLLDELDRLRAGKGIRP